MNLPCSVEVMYHAAEPLAPAFRLPKLISRLLPDATPFTSAPKILKSTSRPLSFSTVGSNGGIALFGLGKSAGLIEGVLTGMAIPLSLVRPQVWQRHHGQRGDKGASRATAMRLWPGAAGRFLRVKDDGRAEAALVGAWGAHWLAGHHQEPAGVRIGGDQQHLHRPTERHP